MNMKTIETAKEALRAYLSKNKEQVIKDLAEMRSKSEGKDIFKYVENVSKSFSLNSITIVKEVTYSINLLESDFTMHDALVIQNTDPPFCKQTTKKPKKTSKVSRSFLFLLYLQNDRRRKCNI